MSTKTCLGKIASAHGIKGLVKIIPYGEDPTLIETLGHAYTSEDASAPTLKIKLKNPLGKYILAEIDGCTSRNDADDLRGTELFYNRADLPEPAEDEFYYDDLIGLTVNEDGETLGTVKAVQNYGAGDLFEIQPPSGSSFFIPYADEYVLSVDLDAALITAQNTKDLREE